MSNDSRYPGRQHQSSAVRGEGALLPWPGKIPILSWLTWYLKHLRASPVAQTVKNLPAKGETWVGKSPWRRKRLPTPVFLPGESHRQRSLAGYSLWGCKVGHNRATSTNYSTLVDQTCLLMSSKWKKVFRYFKCGQIFSCTLKSQLLLPWWLREQRVCLHCGRPGSDPWTRKIPWRRKCQPTPAFSAGKSHGWRSLAGYSPWGRKESDTTERLHFLSLLVSCLAKYSKSPTYKWDQFWEHVRTPNRVR